LADGLGLLEEGADQASTPGKEWQVCPVIPTIVANDSATARKGAAWVIAFYLTTMGPIYRNVLNRYGHQAEVAAVLEANQGRKPSVVPSEAEVLLDQLTLYGTGDEVREKLAQWYAVGATMPALMTNPHLELDQISFVLNAFQPQAG
jgi:alkanesulfonate monooxygenase SsuD/methylene tetrahydromethanopterin reductase-like flavin-dependent oxidoreductase (luciferase family)